MNKVFRYLLLCLIITSFSALADNKQTFNFDLKQIINFRQKVYFFQHNGDTLPVLFKNISKNNPGLTPENIKNMLIEENKLIRVSKEFSNTKFGLNWKDSNLSGNDIPSEFLNSYVKEKKLFERVEDDEIVETDFYPDVAIAYINKDVGYGLFSLDYIKEKSIIAEYTGEVCGGTTNCRVCMDGDMNTDYLVGNCRKGGIDATYTGNAARFGQGAFDLSYKLDNLEKIFGKSLGKTIKKILMDPSSGIKQANSLLSIEEILNNKIFLIAIGNIQPFEQIGVSYQTPYWKEWESRHGKLPSLFDNDGHEITTDKIKEKYSEFKKE